MSGATPGATWQSAEMTDSYLRRRETLIPFLDLQEELIGILLDLDYVSVEGTLHGSFHERMVENAICAEHERGGERTPMQIRAELSEDGVGDEDLPDTAENQVQWLRDAGFEHAEIHFKWGEAAVYGGVRPSSNAGPQAPRT